MHGIGPQPLRTNFRSPNPFNAFAIKKTAYHEQGIIVISIDDPDIPWPWREMLKQIGDRKYGPRG